MTGELGAKGEGMKKKYKLVFAKCHGDTENSIRNIVNSIIMTICRARWVLE